MSKNFYLSIFFGFFFNVILGQNPIEWITSTEKINDSTYNLTTTAKIENNWRLYSQYNEEGGAILTEFIFSDSLIIKNYSKVIEPEPITKFDPVFNLDQSYFVNQVTFNQRIVLSDNDVDFVNQTVYYQVCDDRVCIFQEQDLMFNLSGISNLNKTVFDYNSVKSELVINFNNKELISSGQDISSSYISNNYLNLFILGFLGGVLALLTPCVFPMIPLTVSFFSSKGSSGKFLSVMYGLFIVFIYLSLSLPFYFIENINPQIFNQISTSPILNFLFFLVFILFALSLFGLFEITLPSSWTNKIDNASNISTGMISTFFMALTLCLVSFSCTGPILGSLLVGSITSQSGALDLTFGMLGFGVSLALPFTFLAISPNSLKVLPKSGIWLSRVKVILGFIELALAFKFLSNADLILELGLLKREVFIIIWILISLSCLIYLINSLRFKRSLILYLLIAFFSYSTINLSLGVKEKSSYKLALLSGLLPPTFYTVYENNNGCPLGLNCFKDFEKGLLESRYTNKPMLIDFTGWACANCRRVEENTWSKNDIYNMINDEFILISLYVDDRSKLLNNKNINLTDKNGNVKILENEGEKWSAFQTLNFNINSQPYYVLVSPSLNILNSPIQYTDTQTYRDWLKEGLDNFKDNN
ncbi:MAG: thiol:disulfide interchange protein DsbD [Flavobacteriaceae bacterium]|nr:MAG: thiol:disulfide interchange protein DsbD [Flavobacteriaceae bacterium]